MQDHKYQLRSPQLIAVLGIDGSGKTTQLRQLRSHLVTMGAQVEFFRRTSDVREMAHRIARSEGHESAYKLFNLNALTLAGALEYLSQLLSVMAPNLCLPDSPSRYVLLDNYAESFRAIAASQGLRDFREVDFVFKRFPAPSLKFYLRISVEVAAARILQREGGYIDNEKPEKLMALKTQFDALMTADPDVITVDGEASFETVRTVILEAITKRIDLHGAGLHATEPES